VNEHSEIGRTRQRLRDRLREATLREIMNAAEEVFAESGLESATMAQIAERAGVAVGTLYNRFADRDALMEALHSDRRAEVLAELDRTIAALESHGFREQLTGFFTTWFEKIDEHRPFFRLLLSREVGPAQKRAQTHSAMFDRLEGILKRGHREKLLKRDVDRSFVLTLFWMAKGILQREVYGLEPLGPREAARWLVSLFLDGAAKEGR
jgi:AcrR family transcriptional regulator